MNVLSRVELCHVYERYNRSFILLHDTYYYCQQQKLPKNKNHAMVSDKKERHRLILIAQKRQKHTINIYATYTQTHARASSDAADNDTKTRKTHSRPPYLYTCSIVYVRHHHHSKIYILSYRMIVTVVIYIQCTTMYVRTTPIYTTPLIILGGVDFDSTDVIHVVSSIPHHCSLFVLLYLSIVYMFKTSQVSQIFYRLLESLLHFHFHTLTAGILSNLYDYSRIFENLKIRNDCNF